MIISHLKPVENTFPQQWTFQSNEEHSNGVAILASQFASEFGFENWGKIAGLLHDKGKEQDLFQKYISKESGYDPTIRFSGKVNHAYVGALIANQLYRQSYPILSHIILGHHGGLKDYGDFELKMREQIPEDINVIPLDIPLTLPSNFKPEASDFNHLIRILYSCLVDADYLDTEGFMNEENAELRKDKQSLCNLLPKLEAHLQNISASASDTPVNKIRAQVQKQCIVCADDSPGFFSLTVPTGGGKTLSSLVWAMKHAIKYNKRRIIIAIPYTSIIVQTAEILREIFGVENILEHHSNVDLDFKDDEHIKSQNRQRLKLATENWDYPIIVTTNVRLFESMYSNKPSACRKLHNISNSVIILDEVQTLPTQYLQPIVDGLKSYQRLFGASILFTTASQPILTGKHFGTNNSIKFDGIDNIKEIVPQSFLLHEKLSRVNLSIDEKSSNYDEIAERISKHDRVLCIVNTRKVAQELFSRLPKEGLTFHLSRMMCPIHVKETIQKIKDALKNNSDKVIRVVATQLIEAGVDIDFPIVYRQEAGLDSILQAAGRCNREGKLNSKGSAYVFSIEGVNHYGQIKFANNARKNIVGNPDWFAPETMEKYFEQLYSRSDTFDKAEIKRCLNKPCDFSFKEAHENFRLIDDNGTTIYVNYGDCIEIIAQIKSEGLNPYLAKKLNQYGVTIKERDFKALLQYGAIKEELEGIYFLHERAQYHETIGLTLDNHWLEEILIK